MAGLAGLALKQGAAAEPERVARMLAALAPGGAPGTVLPLAEPVACGARGGAPASAGPLTLLADAAMSAEALLQAWREQGAAAFAQLAGSHAIALHDRTTRRLLLYRDPLGLAPLYLAQVPGGLAFASTPRALLAAGLAVPGVRREARDELLQLHFTTGAETILPGLHRLLPGETVVIADGAVVERHRRPALPPGGPEAIGEAAALARLDAALDAAAARAAEGAAALAPGTGPGGLVLLAALRRRGVRLPGLAARFGAAEAWRELPAIVAALDDPVAESAIIPAWFLARDAASAGGALLVPDGAEEVFAGYGRYRSAMRPWWLWGRQPRAAGHFDHVPDVLREAPRLWRDGIAASEAAAATPARSRLMAAQAADIAESLPNARLLLRDRCGRAHGVPFRAPFLDPGVIAAGFRLPDALKVRRREGSWLLGQWLARHAPDLPPAAPRQGPAVPIGAWIAEAGERLGPLVAAQPGIAEAARPDRVAALFRAAGGDKHRGFAAWHLLFYALWHRAHVEGGDMRGDLWDVLAARP